MIDTDEYFCVHDRLTLEDIVQGHVIFLNFGN